VRTLQYCSSGQAPLKNSDVITTEIFSVITLSQHPKQPLQFDWMIEDRFRCLICCYAPIQCPPTSIQTTLLARQLPVGG
jgi:hypothetical protein